MNAVLRPTVFVSAILMSFLFAIVASHRAFIFVNRNNFSDGAKIEITCSTSGNNPGLRHELVRAVDGGWAAVLLTDCETERVTERRVDTNFTLTAGPESTGLYKCETVSGDVTTTTVNDNDVVKVEVCQSPQLALSDQHGDDGTITVTPNEKCGYKGEITWLINNAPVLRESASARDVRETEEDVLKISRQSESTEADVCNATAVFTYIHQGSPGHGRIRQVTETLQIRDCRVINESKSPQSLTMKMPRSTSEKGSPRRGNLNKEPDDATEDEDSVVSRGLFLIIAVVAAVGIVTAVFLGVSTWYYRRKFKEAEAKKPQVPQEMRLLQNHEAD